MSTFLPHRTSDMIVPTNSSIYKHMDIGNRAMLNAATPGQHGYAANNLRYVNEEIYVSERPYCVVLSTPDAFSYIPGAEDFGSVLRNVMETRSRSWGGVSSKTTVEYIDVTWQGGQTLSVPSGSSRQFGTISHTAYDLRGEEISRMLDVWQNYLLHDPTILHPKIITVPGYTGDLLLDERAMSCIYFEPDPLFRYPARACLSLAMMLKDGPSYEMAYNSEDTQGKSRELEMEFTGLFEWNTSAAKAIALKAMKSMPLYNPDGRTVPSGFSDVSARLSSASGGISKMMNSEAKTVSSNNYVS